MNQQIDLKNDIMCKDVVCCFWATTTQQKIDEKYTFSKQTTEKD